MSVTEVNKALNVLVSEKYSYNPVTQVWKRGKEVVDEGYDVLACIIRWARDHTTVRDKGAFGYTVLESAKISPELTVSSFSKQRTVRNRNKRIAGKHLFRAWCAAVDVAIVGSLEDFMRRNSLLVKRFYDCLANGMNCVKKRARILGALAASVFFGWDIIDEEEERKSPSASQPQVEFADPSPSHPLKNPTKVQNRRRKR